MRDSPGPASSAGQQAAPVGTIISELAARQPWLPALTCGTTTLTRSDVDRLSNRLARAYADLGVRQGSFVTIGLPNSLEFVLACAATWKLGAIPQPVSHRLPASERAEIVELADPALIVGVDAARHPGRKCLAVGFSPDPGLDDGPLPEAISPSVKAPTSGGSTGRPKLIVSGLPGVLDPSLVGAQFGMRPDDRQLVCGPLSHNGPFVYATVGLLLGQHLVVLERFDAAAALKNITDHRITWLMVVPTMMIRMWRELAERPDRYDLSSIRQLWHMAAPCPEWLKRGWLDLIGPDRVWELYGGTESQAYTIVSGSEWLTRPGTVGRPAFGEIRIFDPDGAETPVGQVGEIFLRQPPGTPPTYQYIGATPRLSHGWESIGDLGWIDADGYLYISDLRTDLILSGGANIYPAEVEGALLSCPGVVSCVVVGLPDQDLGQRVHAVVQKEPFLTEEALRAAIAERLVRYKTPRSYDFVDEQLRDDAGKVRRSAIRDAALAKGSEGPLR